MPSVCNVCNWRIQQLFFLSLIFFPTSIVVNDINFGSAKVIQRVPRRHKVFTHEQERLTPFLSSCYGTLVRVAIGDSTCNACHHMVYTGRPSMKV